MINEIELKNIKRFFNGLLIHKIFISFYFSLYKEAII